MAPPSFSGDTRMWEMYLEYSDIASGNESPGKIKARLAALSVFAESQGLTGYAALEGLSRLKADLSWELLDITRFTLFYGFVFFICRERGQKSLAVNTAVQAWRLSMMGRFRLLDEWCSFVQKHQRHAISEDTWRQLLEFSQTVSEDLSNYDPEGAWPVLVDDFVDSLYRKPTTSSCNLDQHFTYDGEMDVSGSSSMGHAEGIKTLETQLKVPILNKRRRSDSRSEASEAESVDCIAQRLAEMSSPLSCKRVCTSSVHIPETVDASANQDMEPEYMGLPEEADANNLMNLQISARVCETPVDNRHGVSQQPSWSNVKCTDILHVSHPMMPTLGGQYFGPGC